MPHAEKDGRHFPLARVPRWTIIDHQQCSGESPCKSCLAVTTQRVWKLECTRTSIYKELELYSAGPSLAAFITPYPVP